ncbi:hypothetical protein DFH11DRAFT_1543966 [Phellopilus nigrolimitatus]|nr:hypothetical protein DFH11DRAFT_1543966 [Phellopilus nigrolimitatus]
MLCMKTANNSVVFFCLGTVCWSLEPEKICAFLNTTLEFKDSVSRQMAPTADDSPPQASLISGKDGRMVYTFKRQQAGLPLTMGGIPFSKRRLKVCLYRPINAIAATDVIKIGYELFEVRTDTDERRRELRDVLKRAMREDEQKKRMNAVRIKNDIAKDWEKGGECWEDIGRLLKLVK